MKKFARLLALVLACLMVATMLIACKDDPPPEAPFVYDDGGFVADDLPDDLKYNGEVIRVLHWEPTKPEFNTQGGADPVQQAVALRKTNIEDRLDVELDYTSQVGGNNAGHRDFLA